jgi:hypothetical protein
MVGVSQASCGHGPPLGSGDIVTPWQFQEPAAREVNDNGLTIPSHNCGTY